MHRIRYVAFDGEVFTSEQECLAYEEKEVAKRKVSIISQLIDEHCFVVDYNCEEVICDPAPLFDYINHSANSLLTQAFLESFVENLNARNCAYLAHLLDN